jgi:hypothetical protein
VNRPFIFNLAALAIVPLTALQATTATDQIDALYACADDPETPLARASALAQLASLMKRRKSQDR